MGVLNVTPDSFSDGGQLYRDGRVDTDALLTRAEQMLVEGADILDIGGESTRPGAAAVSEAEELDRVVTAVEALSRHCDTIISVDTSTPSVMRASARCGAGLLNDVRGFQRPEALQAAADTGLALCVMHMQGEPDTMQTAPTYSDVVQDIAEFLSLRLADVTGAGINLDRVIIDPGFASITIAIGIDIKILFNLPLNPFPPKVASSYSKSFPYKYPPKALLLLTILVFIAAIINGPIQFFDVLSYFTFLRSYLSGPFCSPIGFSP